MLQKQNISIPFTGGFDQGSDEKTVIPSKVIRLYNGFFDTQNTINKRPGESYATPSIPNGYAGTTMPTTQAGGLSKHGNEPLLEAWSGLFSLNLDDGKGLLRTSAFHRFAPDLEEIRHPDKSVLEMDYASDGTYGVFIWTENVESGGLALSTAYVMVKDLRSSTVLIAPTSLGAGVSGAYAPRVLYFNGGGVTRFYLYWCTDTTLNSKYVDPTAPATLSATNSVASDVFQVNENGLNNTLGAVFDAVVAKVGATDSYIFVTYRTHNTGITADHLKMLQVSSTNGYTLLQSVDFNTSATPPLHVTAFCFDPNVGAGNERYCVFWHANGNLQFSSTIGSGFPGPGFGGWLSISISTTASKIGRVTALQDATTTNKVHVFFEATTTANTQDMKTTLKYAIVSNAAVLTAEAEVLRSVGIGSRAFYFNGNIFLGAYIYSSVQPTFFVLEMSGTYGSLEVVARSKPSQCGQIVSNWNRCIRVTSVSVPSTATYPYFEVLEYSVGETILTGGIPGSTHDATPTGFAKMRMGSPAVANNYFLNFTEMAGSTLYSGACPLQYDGQTVCELGFHYFPEGLSVADAGAGTIEAGTRSYVAVYEWQDANGKTHNSAVSIAAGITIAVNHNVTVTLPTLRLTRKANVKVAVFRTTNGGTVYYRLARSTTGIPEAVNTVTADTVTFVDGVTDVNLILGEFLYTTGGVFEADPYPACKFITSYQSRLWFAGCENRLEINYTEQAQEFFFPAASAFYGFVLPGLGLRACALHPLDDNKLVVLQEQSVGVIFGTGPNRLGLENNFTEVQIFLRGVGIQWAYSSAVASDDRGVWFSTTAGFRHFNRDLTLSVGQNGEFLGKDAGDSAGPAINIVRVPNKSQVLFYTGGAVYVWDFNYQQWSSYTRTTTHGVFVLNAFSQPVQLFLNSGDVNVYFEDGFATAGGESITLSVETSWIKISSLQGFQRIYRAMVLGTCGEGTFSIEVGYNYSATYQTAVTYATTPDTLQIQHHLPVQKCEAVRFRIKATSLDRWTFTGLELLVGLKKGMFKIDSSKRI